MRVTFDQAIEAVEILFFLVEKANEGGRCAALVLERQLIDQMSDLVDRINAND